MPFVLRLSHWLALPSYAAARLCGFMLLVLTAIIIYDVIGRKFFATGSFKLQELEWHLHGAIAVLALGYGYLCNVHVRIDIFAGRMSDRFKLKLELFAIFAFLIPFTLLMAYYGYTFAERSFLRGETSNGGLGLSHRWIIKSAIPLSALLMLTAGLSLAAQIVLALRRPDLGQTPFEEA